MFNFRVDKEIFLFKNGNNSSEIESGQLFLLLNEFKTSEGESTIELVVLVDFGLNHPVKVICQQGLFGHLPLEVQSLAWHIIG